MNIRRSSHKLFFVLFVAIFLLLSACQPAAIVSSPQPTQPTETQAIADTQTPAQPTATPVPQVTETLVQPTQTSLGTSGGIILDYSAVAQDQTIETVAAVLASAGGPWWEAAPEYQQVTLQGYPVSNHQDKAQIYIYPVGDLASANENMGKVAADLQTLLQTQQATDKLPFLPLSSDTQAMHAQVQYLDFKSGKGIRFLTQSNNGMTPINNYDLVYTFQGLTSDGKYYIAAILPVTNPVLPSGTEANPQIPDDFQGYLSGVVTLLNQQPANSFTPDLDKLDTLIHSIEIK